MAVPVGRGTIPVLEVWAEQLLMEAEAEVHLPNGPGTLVHPGEHALLESCHLHNWEASLVHCPVHFASIEVLCY